MLPIQCVHAASLHPSAMCCSVEAAVDFDACSLPLYCLRPTCDEHASIIVAVPEPEVDLDAGVTPEEMQMMAAMGIPFGFDTTQGVDRKDEASKMGAVKAKQTRQARQYMNRRGGFNRNLPAGGLCMLWYAAAVSVCSSTPACLVRCCADETACVESRIPCRGFWVMGCMHGGSLHWHSGLLTKSRLTDMLCCLRAQLLYDVLSCPQGNPLSG